MQPVDDNTSPGKVPTRQCNVACPPFAKRFRDTHQEYYPPRRFDSTRVECPNHFQAVLRRPKIVRTHQAALKEPLNQVVDRRQRSSKLRRGRTRSFSVTHRLLTGPARAVTFVCCGEFFFRLQPVLEFTSRRAPSVFPDLISSGGDITALQVSLRCALCLHNIFSNSVIGAD